MDIRPISSVSFESRKPNPDLKLLWNRGKLPTVKYGFYGDKLTEQNISREHLKPKSLGGKKTIDNIVLASRENNSRRSNFDIRDYSDIETAKQYLKQFIDVKLPELNGISYIKGILDTLRRLGLNIH